jgi:hypothetical protein
MSVGRFYLAWLLDRGNILHSKIGIGQKTIKILQNIISAEVPLNYKVSSSTDCLSHRLVMVVALSRQGSHSIDFIMFELRIQEFPMSCLVFLFMIFKNYVIHYSLVL